MGKLRGLNGLLAEILGNTLLFHINVDAYRHFDCRVVGCKIPDCAVFPEFNHLNPDMKNDLYSSELGMYSPRCGLDNLLFAYGHDEYLYQMVVSSLIFHSIGYERGICNRLQIKQRYPKKD